MRKAFGRPEGIRGALAGLVMSYENRALNQRVVDALGVEPEDFVLELGSGPGVGLSIAAEGATDGLVVGVDPSGVMVAQALRRNRGRVADGRVLIEQAPAESIPFPDRHFDRAFAVNSVQHWSCVRDGLAELHRVLAPGGAFVLAGRVHKGGVTSRLEAVAQCAVDAGFAEIEVTTRDSLAFVRGLAA